MGVRQPDQGRVSDHTDVSGAPHPKSRRLLFIIGGNRVSSDSRDHHHGRRHQRAQLAGRGEPTTTAEPSEPMETPSATPTPTPTEEVPAVNPASNEEVLAAFQGFVNERAALRTVLFARAVTQSRSRTVSCTSSVDPASVGIDESIVPRGGAVRKPRRNLHHADGVQRRLRAAPSCLSGFRRDGGRDRCFSWRTNDGLGYRGERTGVTHSASARAASLRGIQRSHHRGSSFPRL